MKKIVDICKDVVKTLTNCYGGFVCIYLSLYIIAVVVFTIYCYTKKII